MSSFLIPEAARTEGIANLVWDALIRQGVFREDHPDWRTHFVWAFQNDAMREYRLGGWMSMGCKFRGQTWSVDIYREDETPEKLAVLDAVNADLAKLKAQYLPAE